MEVHLRYKDRMRAAGLIISEPSGDMAVLRIGWKDTANLFRALR